MQFTRVNRASRSTFAGRNEAVLVDDSWDDFSFKTVFELVVFDTEGKRIEVGQVKIISRGMTHGRVDVPNKFNALGPKYCSLGQEQNYYETLAALPGDLGDQVLRGLRDGVLDPSILDAFRDEPSFQTSLVRYTEGSKLTAFAEALKNQAKLTPFRFSYAFPEHPGSPAPTIITFNVDPGSMPPTNVHVVIGRNGVGKTQLLGNIATILCQPRSADRLPQKGRVEFPSSAGDESAGERFANLVTVTFSAFDPFRAPQELSQNEKDIRHTYVGLKKPPKASNRGTPRLKSPREGEAKSLKELSREFRESLTKCLSGPRKRRWLDAVQTLSTDPGFEDLGIPFLVEQDGSLSATAISRIFGSLSAGHKIVLLTVTRLVELVEERTLVLLDEPEAHLHPPLLSSFVRVLSNLFSLRNGAGIFATHSPVVLQEVPKKCVWVLRRTGEEVHAERPERETFGENVGVLTRDVFGLEVTNSGFHQLIEREAKKTSGGFDALLEVFGGQLGADARGIGRILTKTEE
jgi:ABC-type cobalamin/Fe3+-siderophores transport system ATPase subunit